MISWIIFVHLESKRHSLLYATCDGTQWYEFWSSKLCEGDLITCRICIPNEFWSTCETLHLLLGCFLITWLKWSLVHFQIAAKMNFAPLSYQWLHRKSKVDQNSFFGQFKSGPNFILNTWSENQPNICDASQVDQSSFGMHIQHVRRSPSHSLLDQNSYHRVLRMIIFQCQYFHFDPVLH